MATKKPAPKPASPPAGDVFQPLRNPGQATAARKAGDTIVRASSGAEFAEVRAPSNPASAGTTATGSPSSGTAAIQAILDTIGMGSMTGNDGQPLAKSLLTAVDNSGLDPTNPNDSTAVQAFTDTWLPTQTAYQQRFPGIMTELANGQNPTSPTDYMNIEDTLRGIAGEYGFDPSVFTPDVVANVVVQGKTATQLASDFSGAFDQVESAPPEVRQAFAQMYGVNGDSALALHLLQVPIDTFKNQLAASEVAGAGAQMGVNVTQASAEKLANLGVTYQTALTAAQRTVAESGLYDQTMGEANQATGPGATPALTQATAFDANTAAGTGAEDQALQQEKENRQAMFKGGGGGASTEAEGYLGIGEAKSF